MLRDELDLPTQLGYLLRAVEELTEESRFLRADLKAHMKEEVEIKVLMDIRVSKLEHGLSKAKGYLMAVTSIGAVLGAIIGFLLNILF